MSIVTFSDIPEEGLALHFVDRSWIPEEVICSGPSSADVFLERKDSRVILNGKFNVLTQLSCDRCLEQFELNLESSFTVDFELSEQEEIEVEDREYHFHDSKMETIFLSKPEIDIEQVIVQQVLLAFPMKKLCDESCHGLCVKCGANLNEGPETCKCEKEIKSPFGVLAGLKK